MSNYATPDPGIIDRPYVQQIPLEALFKNLAYKQAKYDQGYQQLKQELKASADIKAYGQDEAIKTELFQNLNNELAKFDGLDLGDSSIVSQLESVIGGFNSSGDVTGIQARGLTYEKMQREQEAAALKGDDYYNQGLVDAQKYYSGGVYKRNTRFTNDPGIAPKIADIVTNIKALAEKETVNEVDPTTGLYHLVTRYKPGALDAATETIYKNMPAWQKHENFLQKQKFDYTPEQWAELSNGTFTQLLERTQEVIDYTFGIMSSPTATQQQKDEARAAHDASLDQKAKYEDYLDDPVVTEATKSELRAQDLAYKKSQMTKGIDAVTETKNEMAEVDKMALAFSYKLREIRAQGDEQVRVAEAKEAAKNTVGDLEVNGRVPIMDEYYAIVDGKQTTAIYGDPSNTGGLGILPGDGQGKGMHSEFTPANLASAYGTSGTDLGVTAADSGKRDDADNMIQGTWKPVSTSPAFKAILANKVSTTITGGDDFASSTTVNQNIDNVFIDGAGNLGYIYTGPGGAKTWGTVSEAGLKASVIQKGTSGSAKGKDRFNNLVTNYSNKGPVTASPSTTFKSKEDAYAAYNKLKSGQSITVGNDVWTKP